MASSVDKFVDVFVHFFSTSNYSLIFQKYIQTFSITEANSFVIRVESMMYFKTRLKRTSKLY